MRPYIGITDFLKIEQVRAMQKVFEKHKPANSERMLHVGVMMSYKTLHGIQTKWQDVFPRKKSIPGIFSQTGVYNCLHYADYDDNPGLVNSLIMALIYAGGNINALQLDMIWPDPEEIREAMAVSVDNVEVILQIGGPALKQVNNNPKRLIKKLKEYEGVVQRVLLDKSMGRGLGMDAEALIPFAVAIRENFVEIGIGAAGGLGPETTHLVEPLADVISDLSIDAQGRLRPSGSALDPVDWNMAGEYLKKALDLLG
jgi:hypothetical protein